MTLTNQPIRCFDGNAQPFEPFWTVRNAVETGGEPEIEFYGYISEYSWLGDEVTPAKFKKDLYDLGAGKPITVRINSGGGDVIAASVIRAIMTDYPGDITVKIDGMAASAAVIVAMAGKTVKILDSAYMMIHDPAFAVFLAYLDIDTLDSMIKELKATKDGIVATYSSKTGLNPDRISRMMADTTWMSAQEAVALKFADQVIEGGQSAPANRAILNCLKNYVHVPAALLAAQPEPPALPAPVAVKTPEAIRLQAEVQMILSEKE